MADTEAPPSRPDGSPARLLVVDDEEPLVELLRDALRFAGFDVRTARGGLEALQVAADQHPDLLVLDVNLPDLDGFEVCRRLRRDGDDVPVVFLTARDDPDDLRVGFTRGGDDYVTKPFSLEELNLRIQAVLRRTLGRGAVTGEQLACADLVMDVDARRVLRGGQEVSLSPTEFRLLRYLLVNRGRVLSKSQILDHVWQYDFDGDGSIVETYISYLRKKVDHVEPRLVQTVRGFGYTIRVP
ncbi:MAG: response regulator transcription factor [Acidimicrobiia bacterium]|nr:response regulator transcription factor [Acidimicrobiia bacterium]